MGVVSMVPANGWSEEKAWEPAVGESGQSDYTDLRVHLTLRKKGVGTRKTETRFF
jgi:hypothetical protein